MNFIKRHIFLIGCVAVLLAGIGLFVWGSVIGSENETLLGEVEAQCGVARKLHKDAEGLSASLLKFWEQKSQDAQQDAEVVVNMARQTSDRPLIYAKVFPEPREATSKTFHYKEFALRYAQLVEDFSKQLRAGDRPSALAENKVIEDYRQTSTSKARIVEEIGVADMMRPGLGVRARQLKETPEEKLIKDLRLRQAQNIRIYANPQAFCGYDYWYSQPSTKEISVAGIWFTQVAAWIQQDVVDAINQINADSQSVLDSPVKRLIEIAFAGEAVESTHIRREHTTGAFDRDVRGARRGESSIARRRPDSQKQLPCYVVSAVGRTGGADLSGNIVSSWTQKKSDDLIDVVQFEVSVIADTARISQIIGALQSQKFTQPDSDDATAPMKKRNQITVLQMQLEPVTAEAEQAAGYYYGSASLGVLRLVCEYTFFKSGYDKIQPESLKTSVQQEARPGPPGGWI